MAQSVYDCSRSYAALKIIRCRLRLEILAASFTRTKSVNVSNVRCFLEDYRDDLGHDLVRLRLSVSEMETRLA